MDLSSYLARFRMDTIYLSQKTTAKNSMGAIVETPGAETALVCDVQPGSGSLYAAEYGERARNMLFVFADPDVTAQQGDLARVNTATDPDYRVVAISHHKGYVRLDMELI